MEARLGGVQESCAVFPLPRRRSISFPVSCIDSLRQFPFTSEFSEMKQWLDQIEGAESGVCDVRFCALTEAICVAFKVSLQV